MATTVLVQVMEGGSQGGGTIKAQCSAWSFSTSPGFRILLLKRKAERWNDANSIASAAHSISVTPLKYETDIVPDWNPEFLNGRAPQEAYFYLIWLSVCSRPRLRPAAFAKAPSYTFPELTNASTKTTTNYIKKATAVTAASMMVASSTSNPMVWGLTLCVVV